MSRHALLVLAIAAGAAQGVVDVSTIGPQAGAVVADFSLRDQNGATHSLRTSAGSKGTMLVFYRSADW